MEAVKEVLDSTVLESIIPLPQSLKNRKVEVLVFPHSEPQPLARKRHSAFGSLHDYAKPALKDGEEGALARALADKYADS